MHDSIVEVFLHSAVTKILHTVTELSKIELLLVKQAFVLPAVVLSTAFCKVLCVPTNGTGAAPRRQPQSYAPGITVARDRLQALFHINTTPDSQYKNMVDLARTHCYSRFKLHVLCILLDFLFLFSEVSC